MIFSRNAFISTRFKFSPPSKFFSHAASHFANPRIPMART